MYLNLIDSRYDLDVREQDLQSFYRKVRYTNGFHFARFEQFLHLLVSLDICWWLNWFEYASKEGVTDWFWLIYKIKMK